MTNKRAAKTTVIVERSGDIFKARIKDDKDANAVWAGKTYAEAVGWLVIHLAFCLNLEVVLVEKNSPQAG